VTFCCKLLALAAGLPGLAAAADPDIMNLIMPEATSVFEIKVAKIMASPIGIAIGEAFHQGMTSQLKAELAKSQTEYREQIAALGNLDWSREVQDIVVAGGTTKSAPRLLIVRTSVDLKRLQSLNIFAGATADYEGVPILASAKPGNGVAAFLDNSIVLLGEMADVQSAIRRRGQHTQLPAALAAKVAKYSQYDIWGVTTGILAAPPLAGPAVANPAAAKVAQYLAQLAGVDCGLSFSPDFDLSAAIEARTEKGAAEMAEGLRWLTSTVRTQAKSAGNNGGLEGFKYQQTGRRILVSLHVPEEKLRAGLQQMRASYPPPAASAQAPSARPSNGLPPPAPGTIRVESSEGIVVIPVGKEQ